MKLLLGTTYTPTWSSSFIKVSYTCNILLLKNIDTVYNSVSSLASQHCHSLILDAQAIAERFREAFTLFSECRNIYQKNHVTRSEQNQLCKVFYCQPYTYTITIIIMFHSQQHYEFHGLLLHNIPPCKCNAKTSHAGRASEEEHMMEWIHKWNAGFGLMGEQGG